MARKDSGTFSFFRVGLKDLTLYRGSSAQRAIHVSSMADSVNHYKGGCGIHLIDDPVLSDPESIEPFSALQLGGLRWKWIGRQAVYATKDTSDDRTRDRLQVFFYGRLETEAKRGHVSEAAFSSRRHSRIFLFGAPPPPRDRAGLPSDVNTA
jgi:hypothetical protein